MSAELRAVVEELLRGPPRMYSTCDAARNEREWRSGIEKRAREALNASRRTNVTTNTSDYDDGYAEGLAEGRRLERERHVRIAQRIRMACDAAVLAKYGSDTIEALHATTWPSDEDLQRITTETP